MKKITNKILIITFAIILILNLLIVGIVIHKYNNNTLLEWFSVDQPNTEKVDFDYTNDTISDSENDSTFYYEKVIEIN